MHLSPCEYPRLIINRATGEKTRVRCGRCSSCLNAKAKNWVSRLLLEADNHKYNFMVNLTYSDIHLPKLTLVGDTLVPNRKVDWCIPFNDLMVLCDKHKNSQKNKKYICRRVKDRLGLPFPCMYDVQLFNKRLNKHIHDKYTGTYTNFRYFITSEIGPSTHRPHYHGVYFVDDPRVAAHFDEIVRACWTLGDTKSSSIFSHGGVRYVAQYINTYTHLPSVFTHPKLCSSHIFSKFPPIGSLPYMGEEIRQIYDSKFTRRTVFDSSSSKYVDLPVNATFKNRYFPKCDGYSKRSFDDRISLYRLVEFFPSDDFRDFIEQIFRFQLRPSLAGLCSQQITSIILQFVKTCRMNSNEPKAVEAKLYKAYLVSKRYCFLRNVLNTSDYNMVRQIDEFYKKIEYEKLKDFYSFQQDYSKLRSTADLIHCYPEFEDYVSNIPKREGVPILEGIPDYLRIAMFGFSLDWYSDIPSLDSTYDYKSMVSSNDKIYKDSHKTHESVDYVYSKRLHDLNPQLQQILIEYYA